MPEHCEKPELSSGKPIDVTCNFMTVSKTVKTIGNQTCTPIKLFKLPKKIIITVRETITEDKHVKTVNLTSYRKEKESNDIAEYPDGI